MNKARPIIWGIAIIALGIIFGGNALGFFDLNIFFDGWWTLFIIIPSLISLITKKCFTSFSYNSFKRRSYSLKGSPVLLYTCHFYKIYVVKFFNLLNY